MSGLWTEHRNPEGRTYWFNTQSKDSVWEKPDALKTPFERALAQTKWKEYVSGGRKYYYDTETKESKWDMPDELLTLLEQVEKDAKAAQQANNPRMIAPNFTPGTQGASIPLGGSNPSLTPTQQHPGPLNGIPNPLAGGIGTPGAGIVALQGAAVPSPVSSLPPPASSSLPGRPNLPEDPVIPHNGFATIEEGEKAFMHLLRKAGVDATWTWDQTMRAIITDPLYKALNSLAEKKACWQKYVDGLIEKEREEREARLAKIRPALRNMLKGNPNVFHYTTFPTADKLFAQHPIWQTAKIEAERRMIFEEYVQELKTREMQESRAAHARSMEKVVALFKEMNIDVFTRWRTAYAAVLDSDTWAQDDELQKLPNLDILLAFEDYARVQEREFDTRMRRDQIEKTRRERKAREGFKELLKELKDAGLIKARSKWKDVYPKFAEDERYLNLLGKPGSNPLELFWDVVDEMDQKLDAKVAIVDEAFKKVAKEEGNKEAYEVKPDTSMGDFRRLVLEAKGKGQEELEKLSDDDIQEVFEFYHAEAVKKQEAERRRAERKQRHMQDDLRYALKKLQQPIDVNLSYEEAVPLMENLPEYKALEDEGRKLAFAKFIKRQKERLRERERDMSEDGSATSRRRKEPTGRDGDRERPREREREWDEGKSSRHHRRAREEEHDSRKERDYRDKERDYRRERDRERDGYSSRYDRDDGRSKHDRDHGHGREREDRHLSRSRNTRDVERDELAHDGTEKRERDDRSVSDRSEKRARYDSVEAPRGAPGDREDTPEEGEI